MKTTKLIHFIIIFTTIFFFSCSSSDEDPVTPTPTPTATSITLTSDKSSFDEGETVSFTVKTDLNEDVTSQSSIKVNGTDISGNSYTPTTHGSFTVKATYSTFTSNEVSFTVNEVIVVTITDITITTDRIALGVGEVATFTVIANLSDGSTEDKTDESQFIVNNVVISGNKYLANVTEEITVKATYTSHTSNELSIQISDVATPSTFTKKAVIEDYTGTWCGWCPRVSYAISLVEEETDKVFSVGVHLANGDPMENASSIALRTAFDVNSFPTAFVNRDAEWAYPQPNNVSQATSVAEGTTNLGLAIGSILDGNTMNLIVSTGFAENVSGTKLVIFILEDEITYNQVNYTSYYNGANPIVGFKHNHVLRYSVTDVLGSVIDTDMGVNHLYYSIDLASQTVSDSSKTGVLVMLVDDTGKKVLNAQYSRVNESQTFD